MRTEIGLLAARRESRWEYWRVNKYGLPASVNRGVICFCDNDIIFINEVDHPLTAKEFRILKLKNSLPVLLRPYASPWIWTFRIYLDEALVRHLMHARATSNVRLPEIGILRSLSCGTIGSEQRTSGCRVEFIESGNMEYRALLKGDRSLAAGE